jgi:hypothetical protein
VFDAAVGEGLHRATKRLRGSAGLQVVDVEAGVSGLVIAAYPATMEVTSMLEGWLGPDRLTQAISRAPMP